MQLSRALEEALSESDGPVVLGTTPRGGRSVWQKILGRDKSDVWSVRVFNGTDRIDDDYPLAPTVWFKKNDDQVVSVFVNSSGKVTIHGSVDDVPPEFVKKGLALLAKQNPGVQKWLSVLKRTFKVQGGSGTPYR